MKHIFIVMTLGYWGKGKTLDEAAKNCFGAGSSRREVALAKIIICNKPDFEKQVSVNGYGDLFYPQEAEVIPLFSPKTAKVRLGTLITK